MTENSRKKVFHEDLDEYGSDFEDDEEKEAERERRKDLTKKTNINPVPSVSVVEKGLPPRSFFDMQQAKAESYRNSYFSLNAYERHRKLINEYYLYYPGAKLPGRDTSKDKRDRDIIEENHKFLWTDSDDADTWEKQLAKKYHDKLFKEYCICDLSRFRENKVAMRWRTQTELVDGRGQFSCGEKHCTMKENLKTWEANFAYLEEGVKKNALVKLRLCPECSLKLNFNQKRKEVIKKPKKRKSSDGSKKKGKRSKGEVEEVQVDLGKVKKEPGKEEDEVKDDPSKVSEDIWRGPLVLPESKSREEEFDDYLDDLFL